MNVRELKGIIAYLDDETEVLTRSVDHSYRKVRAYVDTVEEYDEGDQFGETDGTGTPYAEGATFVKALIIE